MGRGEGRGGEGRGDEEETFLMWQLCRLEEFLQWEYEEGERSHRVRVIQAQLLAMQVKLVVVSEMRMETMIAMVMEINARKHLRRFGRELYKLEAFQELDKLLKRGIAYHHAGPLPYPGGGVTVENPVDQNVPECDRERREGGARREEGEGEREEGREGGANGTWRRGSGKRVGGGGGRMGERSEKGGRDRRRGERERGRVEGARAGPRLESWDRQNE
eukprot:768675-Hanusia_phi.AAC.4